MTKTASRRICAYGALRFFKKHCLSRDLADAMENRITNPVVRRAVSQTAKVINAIIREMGSSPVYTI